MNRIFNLIWSATKERWIVVSEKVKGNGKVPSSPLPSLAVLMAFFAAAVPAYAIDPGALPTGGKISSGSATIATSGNQMTVNQSSEQLIANWNSFNIGQNAAVRFNQPNISASALNRIIDQNPTQILGSLSSNGQVYLLNPSGIIFGKTARVDVGGLVATSLTMLDSDFIAGKNKFTTNGTSGTAGSILNQGTIKAVDGGVVALIAPKVTNEGSITANSGSVLLAAGNQVSLDFNGDGLISYTVDQGAVDAQDTNKGLIKADGGVVVMTAKAADALRTATVTNTGIIEARTIQNKAGRILLLSDMQNGDTSVAGTLDASAPKDGDGGFIETSGTQVKIADGTKVTTLAPKGISGTWLIDPTDFTISSGSAAQTISGIGATTLSNALCSNNVTIATSPTANGTNKGDIKVNAAVSWSAHTLTLAAINNIYINANLNGSGTAGLALNYGQGTIAAGNTSAYSLAIGAQVNLPAGQHFSTKQGSNGTSKNFTVITSLGTAADATTGTGQTLQGMARSGNLNGNFVLGNNINASATATWNSDGKSTPSYAGFTPIGSDYNSRGTPFFGIFDGLGHTISDLTINQQLSFLGLFGSVGISSVIRNVGLVGGSVSGLQRVGGLVGYNDGSITNSYATGCTISSSYQAGGLVGENNGFITNSYSIGSVIGDHQVGGLVGQNDSSGTITNCSATGRVKGGGTYTGGLVGDNIYGTIINSYATGSVSGDSFVGGLVGQNFSGTITNSYATGTVTGTGDDVGGLVGYNFGTISNSYATGSVIGYNYVGGLAGNHNGIITKSYATGKVVGNNGSYVGGLVGFNSGTIANIYAIGSVSGRSNVGGLVGQNNGFITNSYAMGNVTSYNNVGGLVGVNHYGTITNSFWDTTTSGMNSSDGGTGKTSAQMMQFSTFSIWNTAAPNTIANTGESGAVWRIYEGHTAPLLTCFLTPLTLANVSKVYNGASQTGSANGALSGQTATGINVGNYSNSYYSNQQGYDIIGGNLSITRKTVTLSAIKTYDGTITLGAGTVTIGTDVTVNGITELLGYSGATTYSKNVVDNASNYIKTITLLNGTGGLAANYALPTLNHSNAPVTVTQKALTMSGLSVAASKVYDGTTKALVTGTKTLAAAETVGQGTVTDGKRYIGDTVSITGTAVGTFNSKNVATASKVTYSGLSLTGSQAGNYTLTIQSPASAKITTKTVTLKATKKHDGSTTLGQGTVTIGTGVTVNGITESLGYSGATAYSPNIADNKFNYIKAITLLNSNGGVLASNYALPTLNHSNAPVTIK